jgi:hypothetical protein
MEVLTIVSLIVSLIALGVALASYFKPSPIPHHPGDPSGLPAPGKAYSKKTPTRKSPVYHDDISLWKKEQEDLRQTRQSLL